MFVLITTISAVLAGMGIGGGSIFVLLTTTFLKTGQKEAQTLNLIMFIAVGVSSTISNLKNKKIDLKVVKKTIPLLIIGSFCGSYLFNKLDSNLLKKYFLYFLTFIGTYEIITSLISLKKEKNNSNK